MSENEEKNAWPDPLFEEFIACYPAGTVDAARMLYYADHYSRFFESFRTTSQEGPASPNVMRPVHQHEEREQGFQIVKAFCTRYPERFRELHERLDALTEKR